MRQAAIEPAPDGGHAKVGELKKQCVPNRIVGADARKATHD